MFKITYIITLVFLLLLSSFSLLYAADYPPVPLELSDSSFTSSNPSLSTGNLFLSEKITDISDNIQLLQDIELLYSTNNFPPASVPPNQKVPLYYSRPNELGVGWDMNFPYIQARPNTFVSESNDWYLYKLFINGRNYELVLSNITSTYREYKTTEYSNLNIKKYNRTDSGSGWDIESYWVILDTKGNEYIFNHPFFSLLASTNGELPQHMCYQEKEDACGIKEPSFKVEGHWYEHSAFTYWNAYDSNWSTYAQGTDGATLYINYTKPVNALPDSLWKVKNAGGMGSARTQNLSIPSECWDYTDTLQFRARIQNESIVLVPAWNETEERPVYNIHGDLIGYETIVIAEHPAVWGYNTSLNWECYAQEDISSDISTSPGYWYTIRSVPDDQTIYEEAMWWHLNLTEIELEEIDFDFEISNFDYTLGLEPRARIFGEGGGAVIGWEGRGGLPKTYTTQSGTRYTYATYISRWDITKIKDKNNNEFNFSYSDKYNCIDNLNCNFGLPVSSTFIYFTITSKISNISDSYGHEIEFNYDTLDYENGFCFRGFNDENCYRLNSIKKYLTKDGEKTLIENNILRYNIIDISEDEFNMMLEIDKEIDDKVDIWELQITNISLLSKIEKCFDEEGDNCLLVKEFEYYNQSDDEFLGLIKNTKNINGGVSSFEYELNNGINVPMVYKTYYRGNEPIINYPGDLINFDIGWNIKKIINYDPIKEKDIIIEYNYFNPKITFEFLPMNYIWDTIYTSHSSYIWGFEGKDEEPIPIIFYNKTETIYEDNGKKIDYFYNGANSNGDREGDLLKGTNYKTELYSKSGDLVYSSYNGISFNEKTEEDPKIYSILIDNQTIDDKGYIQYKEFEYNEYDQKITETIGYGEDKVKTHIKYLWEDNPEILEENLFDLVEYQAQGNQDTSKSDLGSNNNIFDTLTKNTYLYIDPSNPKSLSVNSIQVYDKKTNKFIEQKSFGYLENGLVNKQITNGVEKEFVYTDTNKVEIIKTKIGLEVKKYDDKDNLIESINVNNAKTRYEYDDFNRLIVAYLPGEEIASKVYTYNKYHNDEITRTVIDEDTGIEIESISYIHYPSNIITNEFITSDKLKTTKTYYDGFGNQMAVDTNKGDCKFERCEEILRSYTEHDIFGNVLKQSKPISIRRNDNNFKFPNDVEFIENVYSKDPLAKLEKSYDFSGTLVSEQSYYGTGLNLIQENKDALGNTIKTTTDNFGRQLEVEDSLRRKQSFEYEDTTDNIKTYIDPLNRETKNIYDFRRNNIYSYDPDRGYLTNFYDNKNNLVYTSTNNFIIDSGFELEKEEYSKFMSYSFGSSSMNYISSGCYSGKCLLSKNGKIEYIYEIPFNQKEDFIIGTYAKGGGLLFEINYLDKDYRRISTNIVGSGLSSDWEKYPYNLTSPLNTEYIKLRIHTFGDVYLDNLYLTPNKGEEIDYLFFYNEYDESNRLQTIYSLEKNIINEKIYGDTGALEGGDPSCSYGMGKICYQEEGNLIIEFQYNEKGLIKEQIIHNKLDDTNTEQITVTNTFDILSLTEKEIEEQKLKYNYDNLGRVTSIKYEDQNIANFNIDDYNRVNKIKFGNSFENTYNYDINNRLIELRTDKDAINYFGRKYTYDDLSNIISIDKLSAISHGSIGRSGDSGSLMPTYYEWQNLARFRYDEANRLTDVFSNDVSLFEEASYLYDELDNRLNKHTREGIENYNYDFYEGGNSVILNSVNSPDGRYIYEYDNMNRLISKKLINPSVLFAAIDSETLPIEDSNETIYDITYDDKGNLKTINGSFGNESYYYSLNGKRIIKNINNSEVIYYFWEGDHTIYEITAELKEGPTSPLEIIDVPLDIGWNMISVGAFRELDTILYKNAYYYSEGKYHPINEKTDLDSITGVWVYMIKPVEVSFKTYESSALKKIDSTYSLIGFNSQKEIDSFDKATNDLKTKIYSINPKSGKYETVTTADLEPGLGYWVYTEESSVIKPGLSGETGHSGSSPSLERDQKEKTLYIYVGEQLISRVDFETPETYAHAPLDPKIYYYHNDHRLNPRLITDQNGSVVMKTDYEIFGEQLNLAQEIENRKDFVGHEQDNSGLQYFGARFYDPQLGRFISPDPIKDGLNPFVYAQNNPMKYVDLNGNENYPFSEFLLKLDFTSHERSFWDPSGIPKHYYINNPFYSSLDNNQYISEAPNGAWTEGYQNNDYLGYPGGVNPYDYGVIDPRKNPHEFNAVLGLGGNPEVPGSQQVLNLLGSTTAGISFGYLTHTVLGLPSVGLSITSNIGKQGYYFTSAYLSPGHYPGAIGGWLGYAVSELYGPEKLIKDAKTLAINWADKYNIDEWSQNEYKLQSSSTGLQMPSVYE